MPNRNYLRGRAKEYRVMKKLKDKGYKIVARTAGSHSPIDIIGIKLISNRVHIKFIQCKPRRFRKKKLIELLDWLNCNNAITEIDIL